MIIVVDREKFATNLDDEVDVNLFIELVLGDRRWGSLVPYGYRGTPGVVISAGSELLKSFVVAPTLKLTERGALKLVVRLERAKDAMRKLNECFKRTR
jgi:hypothetical protein